jgi:hypothetical protein
MRLRASSILRISLRSRSRVRSSRLNSFLRGGRSIGNGCLVLHGASQHFRIGLLPAARIDRSGRAAPCSYSRLRAASVAPGEQAAPLGASASSLTTGGTGRAAAAAWAAAGAAAGRAVAAGLRREPWPSRRVLAGLAETVFLPQPLQTNFTGIGLRGPEGRGIIQTGGRVHLPAKGPGGLTVLWPGHFLLNFALLPSDPSR